MKLGTLNEYYSPANVNFRVLEKWTSKIANLGFQTPDSNAEDALQLCIGHALMGCIENEVIGCRVTFVYNRKVEFWLRVSCPFIYLKIYYALSWY